MSHPFDKLEARKRERAGTNALDDSLLGVRQIKTKGARSGSYGGEAAGQGAFERQQQIEVIREDRSIGQPHLKTIVVWDPKDGTLPLSMEWDVFPRKRSDFIRLPNGDRTLEPDGISMIVAICSRCGPGAPTHGPMAMRGQINLNCSPDANNRQIHHPWFDEEGKLSLLEPLKCGWIPCGWTADVKSGLALPLKGKATRRYSFIPWSL